jgi:RNA polymerase sigma factor (sigma-70 family)
MSAAGHSPSSSAGAGRGSGASYFDDDRHHPDRELLVRARSALDEALERLAALNERQSRIVEYRFYGGMTVEETAEALSVSPATVKREWSTARAWLNRELQG